jgi:hypothetical protein
MEQTNNTPTALEIAKNTGGAAGNRYQSRIAQKIRTCQAGKI